MIYIFSESGDTTTSYVVEYMVSNNMEVERFDLDNFYLGIDFFLLKSDDITITFYFNNKEFEIKRTDSFWFRRGNISTYLYLNNNRNILYQDYIAEEKKSLEEFLISYLRKNNLCIGNPLIFDCSKLNVLYYATKCGFNVPLTYVTYKRKSLENSGVREFVSKPISNILFKKFENEIHHTYVEKISISDICDYFGNSLFQELISSDTEIRVLSVMNHYFAIELFYDGKEHVDSRFSTNHRKVKYRKVDLPLGICLKINKLNRLMDTNMSVIDLIYDKQGNLFLIDFNPCGQYEEISDLYPEIHEYIACKLYEK